MRSTALDAAPHEVHPEVVRRAVAPPSQRDGLLRATAREEADDEAFTGPFIVPLRHVLALADPRYGDPWGVGVITDDDVLTEVEYPTDPDECTHDETAVYDGCRTCDIRRVAHFVTHGIDWDDAHPISVDVGFGAYVPSWPIEDGNHRLLAAAVRGEELVTVEVTGDWDRAIDLLIDGRNLDDMLWAA